VQKRAPDDRSLAAEPAQGDEVVQLSDPSRREDRRADLEDVAQEREIRPGQCSVPVRRRHEDADHARSGVPAGDLDGRVANGALPPLDGDAAVTGVDRDDERLAEPLDRCWEESGLKCGRTDDHTVGSGLERGLERVERPQATADLDGDADLCHTGNKCWIRLANDGAVEVDEVDARRSVVGPTLRQRGRISALGRDVLWLSSLEPNGPACEDIDSGNDLELAMPSC
jgi:hypothetical protein